MKALVLTEPRRMEVRSVADPRPGPGQALVRVDAVGLCGSDYHIWTGEANYHFDASGQAVPLREQAQILGHEITGTVVEAGAGADLRVGTRVIVDQGLNCASRGRGADAWCAYCSTGHTHQCADYAEHGITGLPGGLAERICVPAVNCVPLTSDLAPRLAAVCEPLACVLHACALMSAAQTRFRLGAAEPDGRVQSILLTGAGTAGLLFVQVLRRVLGFDGLLIVSEPDARKRQLAERFGATGVDPLHADLAASVATLTGGRRVECLIEASGAGRIFDQMPGLIRKQATVLLYGYGHAGTGMEALNAVHWFEPALVAPTGASGALDPDGRPAIYRRALQLLESGTVRAEELVTDVVRGLDATPAAFDNWGKNPNSIKGVVEL